MHLLMVPKSENILERERERERERENVHHCCRLFHPNRFLDLRRKYTNNFHHHFVEQNEITFEMVFLKVNFCFIDMLPPTELGISSFEKRKRKSNSEKNLYK